jgi:hypothetical protein
MNTVVLESVLTCPHCGFAAQETMPTDACLFVYECRNCKTLLRVLLVQFGKVSARSGTTHLLR